MIFRIELEGGKTFYFDAQDYEAATVIAAGFKSKFKSCFYELRRVSIKKYDYDEWTKRPIGGVKL